MFTLKLFDRKKQELKIGDIVKVSLRGEFTFYCEITFLEKEMKIAPFHTFSFHSFEKVDRVPDHAIKSTEERYNIWYITNPENDEGSLAFEKYLTDWRACEHILEESCFTLTPN